MPGMIVAMRHPAEIVREQQINALALQPREARRERRTNAVRAVIERRLERIGIDEAVPGALRLGRHQQPPDLGRDQRPPRRIVRGERRPQPPLGKAEAVMRRGVEIGDPGRERRGDRRHRLVIADDAIEITDRRGPHAETRQRGDAHAVTAVPRCSRANSATPTKQAAGTSIAKRIDPMSDT